MECLVLSSGPGTMGGPLSGAESGTVNGKLVGNSIEFVKLMPVATFIEENGDIRSSDRHPPIYYHGEFVADENLLVGRWYILPKSAGLNEYPDATGTWYADAKQ